MEKRRGIWVCWTVALEKGMFKRPCFFIETRGRSPFIRGERWR